MLIIRSIGFIDIIISANEKERYKYIDVLDGGKLKTRQECLEMVSFPPFHTLEIIPTKEVSINLLKRR